ncbi:Gfo/Idh/MocA family protein [Halosimplex amylolyticum]|uniref:Gfo/Idh/MocA family protein n=1 Tax=Halosimplex amylolyticum TaxID=3396616 RepID=UPI003F5606FF
MSTYRAAVIGTGNPPEDDAPSFSIGYAHGRGHRNHENCELVACADVVPENARRFAREFDIDEGNVYEEYLDMLAVVEPDIVSVCTPPQIHTPIIVDCARQRVVDAVHCEKPMAVDWPECQLAVQECERHDVQLT